MFFALGVPIVDFRESVAAPTFQLEDFRPKPIAGRFLRGFGPVTSGKANQPSFGLRAQIRYDAGNALSFPTRSPSDKPTAFKTQMLFRDLTIESQASASLLLGVHIESGTNRCLTINDLLSLPMCISDPTRPAKEGPAPETPGAKKTFAAAPSVKTVKCAEIGDSLAKLYLHATTVLEDYGSVNASWVQSCPPVLLTAMNSDVELLWPEELTKVSVPKVGPVWSGWTNTATTPVRLLLFEYFAKRDEAETFAFQNRLLRLHLEEEVAIRFASALVSARGTGFVPAFREGADKCATGYQDWASTRLNRMKDDLVSRYGYRVMDLLKPLPDSLRGNATKVLEHKLKRERTPELGALTARFARTLSRVLGTTGNVVINNVGGNMTNVTDSFNNSSFVNSLNNSFNTVDRSSAPDEAKKQVDELRKLLTSMGADPKVPAEAKDEAKRTFETLSQEVASPKPRKDWLSLSGKGLIEAAKACAAIAGPVVTAVTTLLPLFGVPV